MSESYLILHRVRGKPAFDIAEKIGKDSDGDIWIIPTSGHRAYPYHMWPLLKMAFEQNVLNGGGSLKIGQLDEYTLRPPTDWPDHYSCNDRPTTSTAEHKSFAKSLLETLGLVRKVEVERRD